MDNSTLYYPVITDYTPTLATTGVGVRPEITIEFSMEMDSEEFTNSDNLNSRIFLVCQTTGENIELEFVSNNSNIHTVTIRPTVDLAAQEVYQVIVKAGLPAVSGRTLPVDRNWAFAVNAVVLDKLVLLWPPTETQHSTMPALLWQTLTGATEYNLQISRSSRFNTEALVLDDPLISGITYTPVSTGYSKGETYFWRCRASSGAAGTSAILGPWSDWRSFYYGNLAEAAVDSRVSKPHSGTFGVVSASPADGSTDLAAWPIIAAEFSTALASSLTGAVAAVRYEPVDGDPLESSGEVTGTWSVIDTTLLFTPQDAITTNRRYTVTISGVESADGDISLPVSYYFTGRYGPRYIGNMALRGRFGNFLNNYSNDFLNYHIYLASIDVNRICRGHSSRQTSRADLRTALTDVTNSILAYVETRAARQLLQLRYYELLEEVDRQKQLGDFMEKLGAELLKQLGEVIKELKKEEIVLEQEITPSEDLGPITGVRSSRWDPSSIADDNSIQWPGAIKVPF